MIYHISYDISYIIPTIGSVRGFCAPRNVHLVIYIFALDICCQHLGNIRQLEGFCAPFGRKVKECTFCNIYISIYICIGYMLPRGPTVQFLGVDSWAPGPNCPGPNCPGPNCPGPNLPRTKLNMSPNQLEMDHEH